MSAMQSEDGMSLKKANSILPSGSFITYTDSVFTDGTGLEAVINLADVDDENWNNDTFDELISFRGTDNKSRSGYFHITVSQPFDQVGCVVRIGDDTRGNRLTRLKFADKASRTKWTMNIRDQITITRTSATEWKITFPYFKIKYLST